MQSGKEWRGYHSSSVAMKKIKNFLNEDRFLEASETYQSSFVYQLGALRHGHNWVTHINCTI
jgi:hypothetical protein